MRFERLPHQRFEPSFCLHVKLGYAGSRSMIGTDNEAAMEAAAGTATRRKHEELSTSEQDEYDPKQAMQTM